MERFRSIYRVALDAVAELPVRALLTTGKGLEPGALGAIPANVHVEAWVPQRDVLPRAAARSSVTAAPEPCWAGSPPAYRWWSLVWAPINRTMVAWLSGPAPGFR
jgi:hypothetical protein